MGPLDSAPCMPCLPSRVQSHSWQPFSVEHLRLALTLCFGDRKPTGHSTTWKRDFYTSNSWAQMSTNFHMTDEASWLGSWGRPHSPRPAEADDAPPETPAGRMARGPECRWKPAQILGGSLGLQGSPSEATGQVHPITGFSSRLTSAPGKALCETPCSD